ncbi:MAG TPA: hypothetical protein VH185_01740 [Mycobacterium sp.]|jgi:hypothetical protein|nr:hypothetical protein [Mycobacterium sp.]
MTEPEPTSTASEPRATEPPDEREHWHRRGRPFRIAAIIVALAGIVFIVAVIFWSGFILGASEGGHHHEHEGGGSRHESMSSLYAPESASEVIFTG